MFETREGAVTHLEQQRRQFVSNINRVNAKELNLIQDRYAECLTHKVILETMPNVKIRPPIVQELKQIALHSKLGDPGFRNALFKSKKADKSIES
jgi:hypothetical protein